MSEIVSSQLRPVEEQDYLVKDEADVLTKIRNRKLVFILGTYGSLVGVLIYAWIDGFFRSFRWGPDAVKRYEHVAPYLIIFSFVILTIYFIHYYFNSVHPLIKDLKSGMKRIQFFVPGKYQTPFVAEYYLKTPLKKVPLIKIDKDFYDRIHTGSVACICFAPHSKFVLSIEVDRAKVNFNYSVAMDDI